MKLLTKKILYFMTCVMLLSIFAASLSGCAALDVLPRCYHEYTGYDVDSSGNKTDNYKYVCE